MQSTRTSALIGTSLSRFRRPRSLICRRLVLLVLLVLLLIPILRLIMMALIILRIHRRGCMALIMLRILLRRLRTQVGRLICAGVLSAVAVTLLRRSLVMTRLRGGTCIADSRGAYRVVVRQASVTVCLGLTGARVAGSRAPSLTLRVASLLLAGPTLLSLHGVLLVVWSICLLLMGVVAVVAVLLVLAVLVVVVSGIGSAGSGCCPTSTAVHVLIVVRLLRHFVRHVVHLDLVDVGHAAAFALSTAAGAATVNGLGAVLVDMVVLLSKRKPLDLLGLLGTFAQGQEDEPDQDDETGHTASDTANDGTQVGVGST